MKAGFVLASFISIVMFDLASINVAVDVIGFWLSDDGKGDIAKDSSTV
ncbi:MAG: hypothetical protein ACE5PV_19380 [Candidatus Poribacteria bacterium]